jgi:antitoxin MazE
MEFQLPNRPEFTGMIYIRKIYIQKEIIVQVSKWGNSLAIRLPATEAILTRLRQFRGKMPADFKFDREDANARA